MLYLKAINFINQLWNTIGPGTTREQKTLTNPYFNSFDKINFDEMLNIVLIKVVRMVIG